MGWRLALALPVALVASAPAAHATFPGRNGRLAFYHGGNGGATSNIYSVNADGGDLRLNVAGTGRGGGVAWSPDGSRLAFAGPARNRSPNPDGESYVTEIYSARADGTNLRRITTPDPPPESSLDSEPSWSPDGRWIAFEHTDLDTAELRIVRARGGPPRTVVIGDVFRPEWSPKRAEIAYVQGEEVRLVTADGHDEGVIARFPNARSASTPNELSWAPKGNELAIHRNGPVNCGTQCGEIWTVRRDGRRLTRVFAAGPPGTYEGVGAPVWSPDGKTIAFCRFFSFEPALTGLWALRPDGTNVRRIGDYCGKSWQALPHGLHRGRDRHSYG
jgi:Tol biopolymer transport system component